MQTLCHCCSMLQFMNVFLPTIDTSRVTIHMRCVIHWRSCMMHNCTTLLWGQSSMQRSQAPDQMLMNSAATCRRSGASSSSGTDSNGVLWRIFESESGSSQHLQLIVLCSLCEDILQELHAGVSGAHLGKEKTIEHLRERLYWRNDVHNWCEICPTCATRKTPALRG